MVTSRRAFGDQFCLLEGRRDGLNKRAATYSSCRPLPFACPTPGVPIAGLRTCGGNSTRQVWFRVGIGKLFCRSATSAVRQQCVANDARRVAECGSLGHPFGRDGHEAVAARDERSSAIRRLQAIMPRRRATPIRRAPRVLVGEGRGSFRDVRKSGLWMRIVQSSNTHAGA